MPIVTLSKSIRSAAFGAWTTGPPMPDWVCACGPRCMGVIGARAAATWA